MPALGRAFCGAAGACAAIGAILPWSTTTNGLDHVEGEYVGLVGLLLIAVALIPRIPPVVFGFVVGVEAVLISVAASFAWESLALDELTVRNGFWIAAMLSVILSICALLYSCHDTAEITMEDMRVLFLTRRSKRKVPR